MGIQVSFFEKPHPRSLLARLDSPIVGLELARSREEFFGIINQGPCAKNIRIMQINTYMDFVFILLYCITLFLLVVVNTDTPVLTAAAMVAVIGTAIFDCCEDFRLLRLLRKMDSADDLKVALARPVSLVKWTFFAIDLVLVGFALLQAHNRDGAQGLLIMAALTFLAATVTASGYFEIALLAHQWCFCFQPFFLESGFGSPERCTVSCRCAL